jgi:preprotein translocase SecE subunit
MDSIAKYFKATAAEMKQVSWPTTQQAISYSALVIAISVVVALYAAGFDYLFQQAISFIVNRV